jgi:hypothetical protein
MSDRMTTLHAACDVSTAGEEKNASRAPLCRLHGNTVYNTLFLDQYVKSVCNNWLCKVIWYRAHIPQKISEFNF